MLGSHAGSLAARRGEKGPEGAWSLQESQSSSLTLEDRSVSCPFVPFPLTPRPRVVLRPLAPVPAVNNPGIATSSRSLPTSRTSCWACPPSRSRPRPARRSRSLAPSPTPCPAPLREHRRRSAPETTTPSSCPSCYTEWRPATRQSRSGQRPTTPDTWCAQRAVLRLIDSGPEDGSRIVARPRRQEPLN